MAEVQSSPGFNTRGRRRNRKPLIPVRVDMTPLVDLAFLLLTFFVLTAELSRENAIATTFPKKGPEPMKVNGITLLIGKNPKNISWYRGEFESGLHLNVAALEKNGLFDVLKNENAQVFAQCAVIDRQHNLGLLNDANWKKRHLELAESKTMPFVVVKWNDDASYETVVRVLDNLNLSYNSKYAVVKMSEAEKQLMAQPSK